MTNETTNTIEIKEAPEGVRVQVETKTAKSKKKSDAPQIKILETAAKKAGNEVKVTIAPKPRKTSAKKPAGAKKAAKKETHAADEARDKDEQPKSELPAPLKIDAETLSLKVQQMQAKLEKAKLQTTKNAQHVAFGFFLAKSAKGNVLTIQYHENLKKDKWTIRNTAGEPVTSELFPTLWQAHETAVKEF
jgi:hypothetical protein